MSASQSRSFSSVDTISSAEATENHPLPDTGLDALVLYTHEGERLLSFDTGAFTIGRDESCDLILNTRFVSRVHARITRSGGRFFFLEDRSRNGTTLKQDGLEQRVMRYGDRVALFGSGTIGLGERADADGKAVFSYRIIRRESEG